MTGENSGGGGFFARSFRNLNRRGRWPLVSVEKDSHAQPPPAAMAVFPSPGPPPEEHVVGEILGGEAASLREAPLPPDTSLPKSGWE